MFHEAAVTQLRLQRHTIGHQHGVGATVPTRGSEGDVALAAGRLHHAVEISSFQKRQVTRDEQSRLAIFKGQLEGLFQGVIEVLSQFLDQVDTQAAGHIADPVIAAHDPHGLYGSSLDG